MLVNSHKNCCQFGLLCGCKLTRVWRHHMFSPYFSRGVVQESGRLALLGILYFGKAQEY